MKGVPSSEFEEYIAGILLYKCIMKHQFIFVIFSVLRKAIKCLFKFNFAEQIKNYRATFKQTVFLTGTRS